MSRITRTFLAGLLAALPLLVTVIIAAWIASTFNTYMGPGSAIGRFLISIGVMAFGVRAGAYILGILLAITTIFLLGLVVESRFRPWVEGTLDSLLRRIPLISNVYDMSKRVVSIVDRSSGDDLKSMTPVWCFFGGDGGAAVLALMPTPQPVMIEKIAYLAVLVPSAPVPFGGALIYVPAAWVKPADGGVEKLVNVYVSMGVSPPASVTAFAKATTTDMPSHLPAEGKKA